MTKFLLILLLFMVSLGMGVVNMGLRSKLVLFSEVNGQVVNRGKPVAGATVSRHYRWSWKKIESTDQTVTDDEGRFKFKSVITSSITASLLPHQPVISQKLDIQVGKKSYPAWRVYKMNYDFNGELNGKAIDLVCDIDTEPKLVGEVFGISRILEGRVYGTIDP